MCFGIQVKHLLEEIAELQKQKEKIAVDADLMQRTQAKEVSQLRANYQILEVLLIDFTTI